MKFVNIKKAKAQLPKLIKQACLGECIVVTRRSKPVVRIEAITDPHGNRKPGALKAKICIGPEFFQPLPTEEVGY